MAMKAIVGEERSGVLTGIGHHTDADARALGLDDGHTPANTRGRAGTAQRRRARSSSIQRVP